MRSYPLACILVALLFLGWCATSSSQTVSSSPEDCDKAIKNYNKLIRWHEPDKAGMAFVEGKQRQAHKLAVESLKKREINLTDFRILVTECGAGKKAVEAVVEFDYYQLTSGKLKTVTDRQTWVYQDSTDETPAGWWITSPLPEFK